LLRIVFLLSLLGATDLAGSPSPGAPLSDAELREVVITMYRGMCYGECPVYSVRITGDGWVSYSGGSFVKEVGNRQARRRNLRSGRPSEAEIRGQGEDRRDRH